MKLNDAMIEAVDRVIHRTLFGMSGLQLRKYVGLPSYADNEQLMDNLGLHALQAINEVERRFTQVARASTFTSLGHILEYVKVEAESVRTIYAAKAAAEGSDFITGFPLEGKV